MKRTVTFYGALFTLLGCLGFVLAEVGLRLFFREQLATVTAPNESLFWVKDDSLGWTHRPGSTGTFSNGLFHGVVHIDEHGNRMNSATDTFVPDYPSIAFIGDSTVASFEVDDSNTVPAILEKSLRAQGTPHNVINMGVRGYGTDQSVRKALMLAERYRPTDVIYMFVGNDMFDNNVLRQPGRRFGKGVYLRATDGAAFEAHNYPVPDYPENFAGLVILDDRCLPIIHTVTLSADEMQPSWSPRKGSSPLYTYRAFKHLYAAMHPDDVSVFAQIDPYTAITKAETRWNFDFFHAYKVYGRLRARCGGYLEAQIAFLLQQLRTIPSVQRVLVVNFPGDASLYVLRKGASSADSELFGRLTREGVVDAYLDLARAVLLERVDIAALTCPRDPHLCRQGNEWIAAKILAGIRFDTTGTVLQ